MSGSVDADEKRLLNIFVTCEYCKAELSQQDYQLANFLYGLILLTGENSGFIGTTCPVCLNTILSEFKKPLFDNLANILLRGIEIDTTSFSDKLRYFPSVDYSPKGIYGLGAFDIPNPYHKYPPPHDPGRLNNRIEEIIDSIPKRRADYVCSYFPESESPAGYMFTACWFHNSQILRLLNFENKHQRKVFPRYYHFIKLLDRIDDFCWKYGMFMNFIAENEEGKKRSLENLSELAELEEFDFDKAIEDNDGIALKYLDFIKTEIEVPEKWNKSSDFMDILASDPMPFPMDLKANRLLSGIFKTKDPFRGEKLPGHIKKVDMAYNKKNKFGLSHGQIFSQLRELSHLRAVQSFLDDEAENFINDFIGKFQEPTFSYGDLWTLKNRYLEKLYSTAISKKHLEADVKYGFYDRGEIFEIIFDGAQPIIIKKRIGIRFLYHLVAHKNEEIQLFELDKIAGVHPDPKNDYNGDGGGYNEDDEKYPINLKAKNKERGQKSGAQLEPEEVLMAFKEKIESLEMEKEEAERNNDIHKVTEKQEEIDQLKTAFVEYYSQKGYERRSRKKEAKNLRDRIINPIKREINNFSNRKIRSHFTNSFRIIPNKMLVTYEPIPDIEWEID